MSLLCKAGVYSFRSYSFRILPLMPQKKKEKRPKREHGNAERKMKGRKNLKMIVSVVVMEASWYCVTGNLVLKLTISPALVWWNVLLVSQHMSYTGINNLCKYLSYCTETLSGFHPENMGVVWQEFYLCIMWEQLLLDLKTKWWPPLPLWQKEAFVLQI